MVADVKVRRPGHSRKLNTFFMSAFIQNELSEVQVFFFWDMLEDQFLNKPIEQLLKEWKHLHEWCHSAKTSKGAQVWNSHNSYCGVRATIYNNSQWRNGQWQVSYVLKDLWRWMLWSGQVGNSDVRAEQQKIELINATSKRRVLGFCGRKWCFTDLWGLFWGTPEFVCEEDPGFPRTTLTVFVASINSMIPYRILENLSSDRLKANMYCPAKEQDKIKEKGKWLKSHNLQCTGCKWSRSIQKCLLHSLLRDDY